MIFLIFIWLLVFSLIWNVDVDIDVDSSEVNEIRQEWENKGKSYTFQFFDLDPSVVSPFFSLHLYAFIS